MTNNKTQQNMFHASFDKYLLMRKRRRLTNCFCVEPHNFQETRLTIFKHAIPTHIPIILLYLDGFNGAILFPHQPPIISEGHLYIVRRLQQSTSNRKKKLKY